VDLPCEVVDVALPWDLHHPKEAEVELRRMLESERAAGHSDPSWAIEILTQVARAESLQGKLREADRTLLEAEKLLPAAKSLAPKLRVLLERGRALVVAKSPAQARERFMEVLRLATEEADLPFLIDAADMMARIETPKKRHEWTNKALEAAERTTITRARNWRGVLYVRLGWHFLELLQLQKAMDAFGQAESAFKEQGLAVHVVLARSYGGRVLRLMNKIPEALELQKGLLTELDRLRLSDALINEEIAECLQALKKTDEAERYFAKAYELHSADPLLSQQDPMRLKRLKTLGKAKDVRA
jgi:tetratricopeptide (TPR) repeat protein